MNCNERCGASGLEGDCWACQVELVGQVGRSEVFIAGYIELKGPMGAADRGVGQQVLKQVGICANTGKDSCRHARRARWISSMF